MASAIKNIRALGFQWATQDPFLFCVHHEDLYPEGNENLGPDNLSGRTIGNDFTTKDGWRMYHGEKVPGFPGHPHRGFETLTAVRKGWVDHSDSQGATGRYGEGDLQWMTAGKGLLHSEMFPLLYNNKENPLELFQIWLNSPAKSKMVDPDFKMFWHQDIPKVEQDNGRVLVEVLAGVFDQKNAPEPPKNSWAHDTNHHVGVFNIFMQKQSSFTLPATGAEVNRSLYFYKGNDLTIDDQKIQEYHAVDVQANEALNIKTGDSSAQILVLQGQPINENVVQHGPFVMNSEMEIKQAFAEFRKNQFGGWPWDEYEKVHEADQRRFAIHADGTKEIPEE